MSGAFWREPDAPDKGGRKWNDCEADKRLMRTFAAAMLDLLLSGLKPSQVNKDLYPGKTPPKSQPYVPRRSAAEKVRDSKPSIEELYTRFLVAHPERAKLFRHKGRIDK